MKYVQNIPIEYLFVVVVVSVIFAVIVTCVRNAEERDEDEVLFRHLNGMDREIKKPGLGDSPSAGQEVKK